MVINLKTTLNIDDSVMARLKREDVQRGSTMSELVQSALGLLFRSQKEGEATTPPNVQERRTSYRHG